MVTTDSMIEQKNLFLYLDFFKIINMCMFYSFYLSVRLPFNGDWISVYTKGYNSIPININKLQVKILFIPHIDINIASNHLFCIYDFRYSLMV